MEFSSMNLCELRNVALERKARDYTYRLRIESLTIRAGEKSALRAAGKAPRWTCSP
mgnify:CR=1 FL=1